MDTLNFASHPSDPLWEEPTFKALHTITVDHHGHVDSPHNKLRISERSARLDALDHACMDLEALLDEEDTTLDDVRSFLAKWEDSSSPGAIQANVLAWFNDTDALESACENNKTDIVKHLLVKGLTLNAEAVDSAARCKNGDILRLFIDSGWDINQPLHHNIPPVVSLLLDRFDLVDWCLTLGANLNVPSQSGKTILSMAVRSASLDTIKLLVANGGLLNDVDLVACAAMGAGGSPNRREVIEYLLDQGLSIDAFYDVSRIDECGALFLGSQNALHIAIGKGMKDIVQLLVERGADITMQTCSAQKTNGQVMTPLDLARRCGHEDIAAFLNNFQETKVDRV